MLTILIIFVLAIGFYSGARRGLVLQIILTLGYFVSYVFAKKYYLVLAKKLELIVPYPTPTAASKLVFFKGETVFKLDEAFYAGVAFLLILVVGWLATRFIGMFMHNLTFFPVVKQLNSLGGGLLSAIMVYLALFMVLLILSLIPVDFIQALFRQSKLAHFIVESTPYFSKQVLQLWMSGIK